MCTFLTTIGNTRCASPAEPHSNRLLRHTGLLPGGLAIALNISWIILNWRETVALVLGIIFFALIIAGLVVYTVFLVREITAQRTAGQLPERRHTRVEDADRVDPPLSGNTATARKWTNEQRKDFYRIMLEDTDRLLGTVEQVLKAGEIARHAAKPGAGGLLEDRAGIRRPGARAASTRGRALRFTGDMPTETTVLGNPEELRIAVANLLDNAVKYSGSKKDIEVQLVTPDIDTS